MITQFSKKRVAFTWSHGNLSEVLAQATTAWYALGNSQPFRVILLFEGTLPARGWVGAMMEDGK